MSHQRDCKYRVVRRASKSSEPPHCDFTLLCNHAVNLMGVALRLSIISIDFV
jgi:hypothetical protein